MANEPQTSVCLPRDMLIGLLQDSLAKEDQLRTAEHVQTCEICQHELETICEARAIEVPESSSVESEYRDDSVAEWSGKLVQKLMVKLQQDRSVPTADSPTRATIISYQKAPAAEEQTVSCGAMDSETDVAEQHSSRTDSPVELCISEMFGRYKVEKILGQGGMGAVYLARDTQLDRNVAIKIPKFGSGKNVDDQKLLERFYREARAAATLRSPYICPVHDVGEIEGQHYISMAYIEGRPLRDFTKSKKKHSEKQIVTTVRKLAQGLSEAHEIGVIHRDLKPANIMVDKKGDPVVMDFGLARRSCSDDVQVTQSGAIMGTPAYMSPEQVEGDQDKIGPQADIYALGIIMYELITGETPYKGSLMSILQQIALNDPEKPSKLRLDLDPRMEQICLKMMAGDLSKRYQSMDEVAADLQELARVPRKECKQQTPPKKSLQQTSISSVADESNLALISIATQSVTDQRREKRGVTKSKRQTSSRSSTSGGNKKLLLAGGVIGLLLLGIVFLVRVGKYDVQITLDDPGITLSVDGDVLNIKDGQDVYQLSAGPHKLQLQKDGFKTHVEEFTVTKDGKTALTAKVVDGKLGAIVSSAKQAVSDSLEDGQNPRVAIASVVPTSDEAPRMEMSPGDLVASSPNERSGGDAASEPQIMNIVGYPGNFVLSFPERTESYVEMPTLDSALMGELLREKKLNLTIEFWLNRDKKQISPHDHYAGWSDSYLFVRSAAGSEYIEGGEWGGRGAPPVGFYDAFAPTRTLKNEAVWTHVAAVLINPIEYRLFIDGKLVDKKPAEWGWPGSVDPFQLMAQAAGMMGETRVSTTARYDKDFTPEFGFKPDEHTLALYHFDEGTGDILKDSSGKGHHGKIIGAKWVSNRVLKSR